VHAQVASLKLARVTFESSSTPDAVTNVASLILGNPLKANGNWKRTPTNPPQGSYLYALPMLQSSGEMDLPFSFINVKNPKDTKSQELRRQVSHHVGKYYRNRSKPSQKKILKDDAVQPKTFVWLDKKRIRDSEPRATDKATQVQDQNISKTTVVGLPARQKHFEAVWRHIKVTRTQTVRQFLSLQMSSVLQSISPTVSPLSTRKRLSRINVTTSMSALPTTKGRCFLRGNAALYPC